MGKALKDVNVKATPQMERTLGVDEVRNNAGGFVFEVSPQSRLERFLILGTDGGTYYVGQKDLTNQNVDFLAKLIKSDLRLVVDTAVDVSVNGRAYKNSPAIFALALALQNCEPVDKSYVREAVQKVCRTSTHLFEFAQYVENLGGWGRAKRATVAQWYESKDAGQLAYQVVKYRQRDGWTHRDLLRLSHAQPDHNIAQFVLGKTGDFHADTVPQIFDGFLAAQSVTTVDALVNILKTYPNLPWEAVPTQFHKEPELWKTLFYNGQLNGQALVRNITRLSRNGAFKDLQFVVDYAAKLIDEEMIKKTRLHPINYLNAVVVHKGGQVDRSGYGGYRNRDWAVVPQIVDALNEGFHRAFKYVEPAGKRTFLGVDVSGSMSGLANGLDLSCAQVSGALAMTIARTEPLHVIRGFTSAGGGWNRGDTGLTDLGITAKTSLPDAMRKVQHSNFGATDCALPMIYAEREGLEIDTFAVITDNETWAGNIKPFQALKNYRKATGIDARLAVFGVAATPFTIADPSDSGMMDFVGFDSNAPKVFADFSAGRL